MHNIEKWKHLHHELILKRIYQSPRDRRWHDNDMTWHDMTWHSTTCHDMTWHDTSQHETKWHDISVPVQFKMSTPSQINLIKNVKKSFHYKKIIKNIPQVPSSALQTGIPQCWRSTNISIPPPPPPPPMSFGWLTSEGNLKKKKTKNVQHSQG